jgi:flagella synthesis protein FlgN
VSVRRECVAFLELVRDDQSDFQAMRDLLQAQFDAALRHDPVRVAAVCESISALTERITQRGHERLALARRISGADGHAAYEMVQQALPHGVRATVKQWYTDLQAMVTECQRLNARNCDLLMGQYEIMQRVLNDEVHTYAPA